MKKLIDWLSGILKLSEKSVFQYEFTKVKIEIVFLLLLTN